MQDCISTGPSSISKLSTGSYDGQQAIARRRSRLSNRSIYRFIYRGLCSGLLATALGISGMSNGMEGAIAAPLSPKIAPFAASESVAERNALTQSPSPLNKQTQLARSHSQSEVRSIWLDRETIVNARSPEGLAQVFESFRAAGINTVFVETVNAGYPIYPSEVAPEQNPLTRGWDPLQAAVNLGKVYDIEVHAWVWLFAVGNRAHNRLVGQPENYPGPVLSARPDWAGFDNQGNLTIPGKPKFFVDPANPEVRQYLFDILDEIATRYDVDGVQFDYVRYPFQDAANDRTFGYGTAARAQFYELTGVDPADIPSRNGGDQRLARLWTQWTDFRAEQISSFVAEASQRLRSHRRDLTISAAVFSDDTYYRHHTLQQDWETWADQGLVDWIVLMSYARNTSEFSDMIRPWVLESSFRDTQVIPGIRLLNLPPSEAISQIEMLRDMPVGGYALFAADNLNGEVRSMLTGVNVDWRIAIASKQD